MRGTCSIANARTCRSRSAATRSAFAPAGRKPRVTAPVRSRPACSSVRGDTVSTTSLVASTSSTTSAPASRYASSVANACAPAPLSTATARPASVSLPTASGTSATRRSPARCSETTPTRTIADPRGSAARNRGRLGDVPEVRAVAVDADNVEAVLAVTRRPGQEAWVGAVAWYVAKAAQDGVWTPWALTADGVVVGFLETAFDPSDGSWCIGGVVVDVAHQGRGIGRTAMRQLVADLRSRPGCNLVALTVH